MGNRFGSEGKPILGGSEDGKTDVVEVYETKVQPCIAEFLGVAFFVFIGTASVATGNLLAIAVAHGLALALVIGSLGIISGGHLNPAVTVGITISGAIGPVLALFYVLSQLLGAIVGAALCRGVLDYTSEVMVGLNGTQTVYEQINGGAHSKGEHVKNGTAVLAEIVATMLLVLVVLMAAVRNRANSEKVVAPVFIGLVVLVDILTIGPVSGGSMNPARSLGPALVTWNITSKVWNNHWIYWVGPMAGGFLAGLIYRGPITGGSMNPARSFGPAIVFDDISTSVWHYHWIYWVGPMVGAVIAAYIYRLFLAEPDKRMLFKKDA